uniref:Variant surface glycoprotein 1125.1064 n=1 Tax=Trypanosoma brucei TaxID=5691 RepID=A0A1J0R6C4_9TRYP|nr:variant surface glycoprotein 1125.1064 [Trypanosoma brucei]
MLSKAVSIIAALVIVSTPRPVQGTAGNAIAKTHWEPLCKISKNLAGYYNTQETKIPKAIKADLDHIREELKLRILIERSEPQEALKLLPLLAAANTKEYLTPEDLETGVKTALKAARDVAFLHGHMVEFLTMAGSAHASAGTHGCLQESATAATGTAGLAACGLQPAETEEPAAANFGYDPTKLFGKKTEANAGETLTDASGKNCALTKGDGSGGILNSNTQAGKIPYAGGYFYLTANEGNLARHQIEGSDGGTDDTEAAIWTKARNTVKNADQQASSFNTAENSLPSLQDIKDSTAAKATIRKHILKKGTKYNPDVDDTDTNKKADKLYGDQKSYSQTKIWEQMKSISIDRNIYNKDLDQDQKLSDITDINHLRQILTYYQGQRAAELAAMTKELQKTTENSQCKVSTVQDKDKVCNEAGGDKKACDKLKGQGCVFNKDGKDGEECTLSEEGKQQSSTSSSSRLFQTVCQRNRNDSDRHNKPGKTSGSSLH